MNVQNSENYDYERAEMVENQLQANGITSKDIIEAFLKVPRHQFVPDDHKDKSYLDMPLPIGHAQTISQPFVVAFMLQRLELMKGHKVLEVGTGSGYQTALLSEMGCEVITVEFVEELSRRAELTLKNLEYKNVKFVVGDGRYGFEEGSPYDRIVVSAASGDIPENLIGQLNDSGGRMIIPVGRESQHLVMIVKKDNSVDKKRLGPVKFVPLVRSKDFLNS